MPRFYSRFIAVLILSLIFSSTGHAVTTPPKNQKSINSIGLTPLVGGYKFSSSQALDTAPIYGLRLSYDHIGRNIVDSIGIEGTVNYFSTTTKTDGKKAEGYLFRTDAIYSIDPRSKWVPFLALGAGGLMIDRDGTRDTSPFLNFGIGLKYFLEDYLAVRADVRQLMVYKDVDTNNNYELSTGLTYYFGKERKKKPVPAPPKPKPTQPAVPSIVEEAPAAQTPALEVPRTAPVSIFDIIGAAGAAALGINTLPPQFLPAPPPLPATPPSLARRSAVKGATGEEVPSQKVEPAATEVPKQKAAPAATAVPVPKEEPSATVPPAPALPPAQVEPVAPIVQAEPPRKRQKSVKHLTVEFIFSSSAVRPLYNSKLAAFAEMINSAEQSSALIEGHTDSIGKSRPNIVLSQRRAQNVKNELVRYGVDPDKIVIKGYGYTKPKASNKTSKGRQRNRRAVAVITLTK